MIRNEQLIGDGADVESACRCLGVSRSGYARWLKRDLQDAASAKDADIKNSIHDVAARFPRYGYRRVTKALHRDGEMVNHKHVLRIMREEDLLCRKKSFRVQTTDSNHQLRTYPNLAKDLALTDVNQLWVSDITYIQLPKGFAYLAVIMDVFSRKCIGWALGRNIDRQLVIAALERALKHRSDSNISGLVHHSDRGVQYACEEYVKRLRENRIMVSMGRKGNPYDNAFAESFIKTLKYEEAYLTEYESFNDAYEGLDAFIKAYNEERLHSSIGYATPNEFESINKVA